MRFPPDTLAALADGRIDLAFRRWERPRVNQGGIQRTPIGVIGFESVQPVSREEVSDDEARRAGFETRDELLAALTAFARRQPIAGGGRLILGA